MATFIRYLNFVLLLQSGLSYAGHVGHGHLHEVHALQKRAAQVNPTVPGNWS
jgi:hypothetical protein